MKKDSPSPVRRSALTGISLSALFAALIAAGSFIAIPLPVSPVPVVLQNMFALLAGMVLGPALGAAAAALYLIAGAVGAPVFAGASGGFAVFMRPSGGFLYGYLLCALSAGLIAGRPKQGRPLPLWRKILAAAAGLLIVYVPGLIQLKLILDTGWFGALAAGCLPFLAGDALKGSIAVLITPRLRRSAAHQLDP